MRSSLFLTSILSLLSGTVIYLLFRTSSLKVFEWLEILKIDFLDSDIRKFCIPYAQKLDEGEDIMKTGGFPEIMTQAENEESESTIQKSEGRYYLNVNASGNWTVTIEELR